MPAFWVAAVAGSHRLSRYAVKASITVCGAVGSGLVWANRGAVLKTRWAWLLWAYLCLLWQKLEIWHFRSIKMAVFDVFIA